MGQIQDELAAKERQQQEERAAARAVAHKAKVAGEQRYQSGPAQLEIKADESGIALYWTRTRQYTDGSSQVVFTGITLLVFAVIIGFLFFIFKSVAIIAIAATLFVVGVAYLVLVDRPFHSSISLHVEGDACALVSQVPWVEAGSLGFLSGWWHLERIPIRKSQVEISLHRDGDDGMARACVSLAGTRIGPEPHGLTAQDAETMHRFCREAGIVLALDHSWS